MARLVDEDEDNVCEVCGGGPVWPSTGMCGPCTTGEAETAGETEPDAA